MIRTLAPETRQLVIDAQGEAHRLGHGFLGALDRRPVRTTLWRLRRTARTTRSGHLPPTLRAMACLERAELEATGRGHDRIDVEDIALALTATTGGLWQRVVADVGADAGAVRADLLRVLPDG